jgi:hypothetical protein
MKWDVSILSTDEFILEEMITEVIPEKYWFNDQGELLITSNTVNSEETVFQLISFLFSSFFQNNEPIPEMYRDNSNFVLDLSAFRNRLISFDYLEEYYPKWIEDTGRKNTMDEYGMLLDFIGQVKKGIDKKYLLMTVSRAESIEYTLQVTINGDRPDFRIFSVFLWGDDNFDSDGDSYNPASRTWTWLYMASREVQGQYFEIYQMSESPLIFEVKSPNINIANRVALFLAKETNGQIISPDNNLYPYNFLTDKLGDSYNLQEAFERADRSIWRESTLENPYPNIK